jgi:hypothetical protein
LNALGSSLAHQIVIVLVESSIVAVPKRTHFLILLNANVAQVREATVSRAAIEQTGLRRLFVSVEVKQTFNVAS